MCSVAYSGMMCDLDKTVGRSCVLQSPLINDTFNWTFMFISYHLSSHDVKLKLDLLADDVFITSYIMSANESAVWIPNPDLESSVRIQLTASRHLVSAEDYEYAVVSSVAFRACPSHVGRLLYLKISFKYVNKIYPGNICETVYATFLRTMNILK